MGAALPRDAMTPEIGTNLQDDGDGLAVCPKCIAELPPGAHFCPRCRGPVTAFANTGGYESALAEGWSMGESVVASRPSLVTLIGLWLAFLPSVLVGPVLLFAPPTLDSTWATALVNAFTLATSGLFGWCLYRGTLNYLHRRRRPEPEA